MKNIKFVELNNKDREHFQRIYTKHNVIGYLEYEVDDMGITVQRGRVVLKMKPGQKAFTPYMAARDCGDHYILAQYDRYDKIEKSTMNVILDVEDN